MAGFGQQRAGLRHIALHRARHEDRVVAGDVAVVAGPAVALAIDDAVDRRAVDGQGQGLADAHVVPGLVEVLRQHQQELVAGGGDMDIAAGCLVLGDLAGIDVEHRVELAGAESVDRGLAGGDHALELIEVRLAGIQ